MKHTRAQAQIVVDNDGDPFAVTVTHELVDHGYARTPWRNVWHWQVTSTTDAADWQPVRRWSGCDLSTSVDVGHPDPIGALVVLGSFLADYADTRVLDPHDKGALFYGMPQDLARAIADEITVEYPECCDHNDAGPCPTCDHCGRSQCEDGREWNGDTGCHVACEIDLSRIGESVMASCDHRDNATCLRCGLDWCHECDPGPAALCPVCHGRGYSTATWSPPTGAVVVAGTVRRV